MKKKAYSYVQKIMAMQRDKTLIIVEKIDDQHERLLMIINTLINESEEKNEKEAEKAIRHFWGYVLDHFGMEEKYMIKYKYPDYDSHKEEHLQFLMKYAALKRIYKKKGATFLFIKETQDQVVKWLVDHAMTSDKKLAKWAVQ